jgi:hypothetical protein
LAATVLVLEAWGKMYLVINIGISSANSEERQWITVRDVVRWQNAMGSGSVVVVGFDGRMQRGVVA